MKLRRLVIERGISSRLRYSDLFQIAISVRPGSSRCRNASRQDIKGGPLGNKWLGVSVRTSRFCVSLPSLSLCAGTRAGLQYIHALRACLQRRTPDDATPQIRHSCVSDTV